jgi:hypothetical protein
METVQEGGEPVALNLKDESRRSQKLKITGRHRLGYLVFINKYKHSMLDPQNNIQIKPKS